MDRQDSYNLHPQQIVIYTTSSCGDCYTAKAVFHQRNVPYLEIRLDEDQQALHFVERLNGGFASVPTIVFPDGSVLVEPSLPELTSKFSDS